MLPLAVWCATSAAQAQATGTATRPDPLDPEAVVPALRYLSPLAQYRRRVDEPPVAWRDANDVVARIGGWRAYARQAQQPEPAPVGRPAEVVPATPSGEAARQSGHKQP